MWKQPWGYIEGWTISFGVLITGIILQSFSGKIISESFHYPVNVIFGAVFILLLLIFHLISKNKPVLRWFSGYSAAITSVASLLFLSIIMGLTRQLHYSADLSQGNIIERLGFMQMTVSWQFILISLYFLWILGLVILKRLSRFKWKDTGFILNHLGLFIAFFSAILGSSDLQRLQMVALLNESEWRAKNDKNEMVELPLAIELNSFTIDEYPPKLMMLDNVTGEALPKKKPANVLIETYPSATELFGWELEITEYLPFAAALVSEDTINYVEFNGEGSTSALYVKARNPKDGAHREGWVSCGNHQFTFSYIKLTEEESLIMPIREPKRYASDITVYIQNGESKNAIIEVNKPLTIAGWKIYQLSYDEKHGKWSQYSVFELVKDTWLPFVYSGIVMMLFGCVFMFASAPNKSN